MTNESKGLSSLAQSHVVGQETSGTVVVDCPFDTGLLIGKERVPEFGGDWSVVKGGGVAFLRKSLDVTGNVLKSVFVLKACECLETVLGESERFALVGDAAFFFDKI